jgi:type II secretory pathway component PulF
MKTDELAFFNQQLAIMLREGIPLEGALAQLVKGMREPSLRKEFELLQTDLERGTPLPEALERRQLPPFYRRMLIAGAAAQDLPAMLTLLADHYNRTSATWARLKGLMIYPVIVILVALALSASLGFFFSRLFLIHTAGFSVDPGERQMLMFSLWLSPVILALLATFCIAAVSVPAVRDRLRWRLPAFREASLAQLASSMSLTLRNGVPLPEALKLAETLETGTPAAAALASWREQISAGKGRTGDWQPQSGVLPPLFLWVIKSSGEHLASGFQKAAELYGTRSAYRTDLMLYGVLPVSVLLLGQMILWQAIPAVHLMAKLMNALGT